MGTPVRTSVAVLLLLCTAYAGERELQHDIGLPYRVRVEGKRLTVAYEIPEGTWRMRAVRLWASVHSRRGGNPYEIRVVDDRGKVLARALATTHKLPRSDPEWRRIEFPTPPQVAGRVRIVVDFERVTEYEVTAGRGPLRTPGPTHSWIAGGDGEEPLTEGAWSIHPVLVDDLEGTTEIGPEGVPGDVTSLDEATWRAVRFRKPQGTWWIRSVRLHLRCNKCPREDVLRLRVMSGSGHTVHLDAFPVLGPEECEGWVEVPIRAAIRAKSTFRVAVCRTGEEGWASLGQGMHERATSSFDFPDGRPRRTSALRKGRDHRIRAVLTNEKPAIAGIEAWREDFTYVLATVEKHLPLRPERSKPAEIATALRNRWTEVVEASSDDRDHVLAMMQVLADLEDGHARLTPTDEALENPAFDGLDGAGLWIAWDRGRMTLRGIAPDHPLADRLQPGAVLTRIDGRPARLVNAETLWRVRRWLGWSTLWQLQAALGTRFFPFGDREELPATFLGTGGKVVEVTLRRGGPPPLTALPCPPDIEPHALAAGGMLDHGIGYVRILGGMDEETSRAFDVALESVKDARALILDARGAGDGEDRYAAEMAGRLVAKPVDGTKGRLVRPTGPWTFEGAVVLLLDERMAGAAEALALMLSAEGRAITVGGPTAGSTLVPATFRARSRLFTFTMGHRAGVRVEGDLLEEGQRVVGEVPIAWWPGVFERSLDPPVAVATDILRLLLAGADRDFVVRAYAGCLAPNIQAFATARRFAALEKPEGLFYADLYPEVFDEHTRWLRSATEHPSDPMPAFSCAAVQILGMGIDPPESWGREIDANELWNDFLDLPVTLQWLTLQAFLLKHGASRYGKAIRADPAFSALVGE